ncbi:hypothetical protein B9Z55_007651 [Caenorhabditis nigoni]|uniref:BTB domain-containing protein n=1 Tax=Caenorhabditis nigoni TaxID=1611254 RepID=A0A2G5VB96_9PELO|nr:hypothetical protein B9Z55_007651 [Caenorhabditis nigoni]
MSELREIMTHEKLAEHPDSPVTFEFEPCHCFKWSIIANPIPGDCYELCLNAECDVTDAPEHLKNRLEGKYEIDLSDGKTYNTILEYSGKLVPGSTTVTQEVPKSVLENKNTRIRLIVDVETALGLDEKQGEPQVKLDIGGTIFHTTPTTICKYFSRLKRDFKFYRESRDLWRSEIKIDFRVRHCKKDQLFYDRDSENFRYILNFLRDGENMKLPKNREKIEEILEEAKFWMLKELEELCSRKLEILSDFELLNI